MDLFEIRAALEIYEKTIQHPNLSALKAWALTQLEGFNALATKPASATMSEAETESEPEATEEENE